MENEFLLVVVPDSALAVVPDSALAVVGGPGHRIPEAWGGGTDPGSERQPRHPALPPAPGSRGEPVCVRRSGSQCHGDRHPPPRLLRATALHRLCHPWAEAGPCAADRSQCACPQPGWQDP